MPRSPYCVNHIPPVRCTLPLHSCSLCHVREGILALGLLLPVSTPQDWLLCEAEFLQIGEMHPSLSPVSFDAQVAAHWLLGADSHEKKMGRWLLRLTPGEPYVLPSPPSPCICAVCTWRADLMLDVLPPLDLSFWTPKRSVTQSFRLCFSGLELLEVCKRFEAKGCLGHYISVLWRGYEHKLNLSI